MHGVDYDCLIFGEEIQPQGMGSTGTPSASGRTVPAMTTARTAPDAFLTFACSDYEPPRPYKHAEADYVVGGVAALAD